MYYLLRLMKKAKECSAVYTSRSGKPAARVKVDGIWEVNLHTMEYLSGIRTTLSPLNTND